MTILKPVNKTKYNMGLMFNFAISITSCISFFFLDESTFNWILTTAHDRVQEAFISATPFLPRWGVIDETATYIGLCFLAVLSFVLCWLLSLLCTKLLTYLWAGVSTLIEFVVSVSSLCYSFCVFFLNPLENISWLLSRGHHCR